MLIFEYLEVIVKLVVKYNFYVFFDEIYFYLNYDLKFISIISFFSMKECIILLDGYLKIYVMIGWCLGYFIFFKVIVEKLDKLMLNFNFCVCLFI